MENKINQENEPEMECVPLDSLAQMMLVGERMREMQFTHNRLIKDFETLYAVTVDNMSDREKLQPLIRSCLKELFSLIEGDLYLINQYHPYPNYDDFDKLDDKFKKTYRHHAEKFKKSNERIAYQSKSYRLFKKLKAKRDAVTHPKGMKSIDISLEDLVMLQQAFQDYKAYINELMKNVGFSITIPFSAFLNGRIT